MGNQNSAHNTTDHYMVKDKHHHSDHGEARHGIFFGTPRGPKAHTNRAFERDELDRAPPREAAIRQLENTDAHSGTHNLAHYLEEHPKKPEVEEIKIDMWRSP